MIRTLQLAGVHGWVSLRLTVSRGYWLPRLTLALIAGYILLFNARYSDLWNGWGLVFTSFILGGTCVSLLTTDGLSRTSPLPLPRAWLTTVAVLTQLMVCVGVAFGFMMFDVVTGYAAGLSMTGSDWSLVLSRPVPHLLQAAELRNMALMVLASLPFGLGAVRWMEHFQHPQNQLPNLRWQKEFPRWYGILAVAAAVVMGLKALNVSGFALHYATGWLALVTLMTSIVTVGLGWLALFPPSDQQVRPGQTAGQRLLTTMWQSQAIKWTLFLAGFALYMGNPGAYLPDDWAIRNFRGRPLYSLFAVLLPFYSMLMLSSGHSNSGASRAFGSTWAWNRSGWQMVPVPRVSIQRALMIDMIGFAAVSTIALHIVLMLVVQANTGQAAQIEWVQDLIQFTWFVTMFMGLTLPLLMLLFVPRRRFGFGLSVMALISVFWGMRNGIFFVMDMDLGGALALKQHLITVGCWMGMAAVLWAQTGSPSGRLFEAGAPASRWSKSVAAVLGARGTRWSVASVLAIALVSTLVVHRNAVSTEMERRRAVRITAEQTDRLLEDLKRVAELDVLHTATRTRDAGSILNPHIGLDDGTPAQDVAWWDDIGHKYTFKGLGSPWYAEPNAVDVEVGDLSILTRLMAFDHWETARRPAKGQSGVGPYETHLQTVRDRTYLHWGGPFPNMVALINLVKFRLLHGLRTEDVLPALEEVRHLAKLVYSDETFISTLLAVGILRNERRVYLSAVELGLLEPGDWVSISEDDLNRMHRVAVSLDYVMAGGADEAQWRRIAALPFEPFGLCGVIHESITMAMSQPAVRFWPGELFPVPELGFVTHAMSESGCSIPLARHDHRAYMRDTPLDGLFRNRSWHRLLAKEYGENTMLKLTVPYLRGQAWMDIEEGQNMRSNLIYGERAENDWPGAEWKRDRQ